MKAEPLTVLYEDNDILVCIKPAGIASESSGVSSGDLVSMIKTYLVKSRPGHEPYLGVIHRLDQPVRGILVFALNPAAAANLSRQVQSDEMGKYYTATVHGNIESVTMKSPEIIKASDGSIQLTHYLIKDSRKSMACVVNEGRKGPDGKIAKAARLSYRMLSYDSTDDTSTLRITLYTGRFHQIRAQLSAIGHPILGDVKYGGCIPEGGAKSQIALCADELHFKHPTTGKQMTFSLDEI